MGGGDQESGPSGKNIRGCQPSSAPAALIDVRASGTSSGKILNSKHEILNGRGRDEEGGHVHCLEFEISDLGFQSTLGSVAIDDDRLARLHPAAEGFQGQVGPLAVAPHREEPQGEEAQAVEAGVEASSLLTVEFG